MSNIYLNDINSVNSSALGKNAKVYNNYYNKDRLFDDISSNKLEPESDKISYPKIEDNIFQTLKEEKLLVLGGNLGNKDELALDIAYMVKKEEETSANPNHSVPINLWKLSPNRQLKKLKTEIQNSENTTIFLVYDVQKKDDIEGSWFKEIHEAARSTKSYVLVSTDISFTEWHLDESARNFFPDLQEKDIYNPDDLVKFLESLLRQEEEEEKDAIFVTKVLRIFNSCLSIDSDYKSQFLIVKHLINPRNIRRFVKLFQNAVKQLENRIELEEQQSLQKLVKVSNLIKIADLIKTAKHDDDFIRKMYHEILEPREQLLALGLSFFNGLFEDQLFAAIERVVQEVWQKRDASLRAIDYGDLGKLKDNYFNLFENDFNESVAPNFKVIKTIKDYKIDIRSIKIISLNNRKKLFKVAWKSHRRQIVTALNVLVDLVKESVAEDYYRQGRWELYGDPIRSEQLRDTIAECLSEIGLVSSSALSAVQGSLLQLAIDPDLRVKYVAASAIARWRNRGEEGEKTLFRTLQSFYSITLYKEASAEEEEIQQLHQENYYLDKKTKKPDEEPNDDKRPDYIGVTVAVAVGNSIVYYPELDQDSLSNNIYDWLKELSQSRFRLVHLYFGYYTLYWVVPLHLKKPRVREMLKRITQIYRDWLYPEEEEYRDLLYPQEGSNLNHAIATSLAHAYDYSDNWDEVQKVLDDWYNECDRYRSNRTNRIYKDEEDEHNALLKTVALTYGLIQYDSQAPLTVEDGFRRLEQIIEKEKHDAVRQAVVFSTCNLVRGYFHVIDSQLQDCLSHFTYKEYKQIVKALTEVHRQQLTRLKGDGEKIKVKRYLDPVSINLERLLTDIEKAMFSWIQDDNGEKAQKIAVRALIEFTHALNKLDIAFFFTKEMQALVAGFSKNELGEIAQKLRDIYLEGKLEEKKLDQQDYLLQIVVLTYRAISDNQKNGRLSVQNAFDQLWKIYLKEQDFPIGEVTIIAFRLLANYNFKQFEPPLRNLVSKRFDKRKEIVKIMVEVYLDQCAKLDGDSSYPVGRDSEPPLTDIERAMFSWMENDSNAEAQQIAVRALIKFTHALNKLDIAFFFTKEMQALVAGFSENRLGEIAQKLKDIYLEEKLEEKEASQQYSLLKIVILTYRAISDNQTNGKLSIEDAFNQLCEMFMKQRDSSVCEATVIAFRLFASYNFEQFEPPLQALVDREFKLHKLVAQQLDKRKIIIEVMVKIYLDQRAKFDGGKRYVLRESERPVTEIETAMLRWIKNNKNPVAQQVAVQASVEFVTAS